VTAYAHAGFYEPHDWPDQRGRLTPLGVIAILLPGTDTLATLYADRDRSVQAANPVTLDANGNNPGFYAEPGIYEAARVVNGTPLAAPLRVKIEVEVDSEDAVEYPDASEISYTHTQGVPATVWNVVHNLGYKPGGVYVEDSAGSPNDAAIDHIDSNSLTLTFVGATSGFALLS